MPTEDPAKIVLEADLIRDEVMSLIAEVKGKQPTRSQLKRARELQARRKKLDEIADSLLTQEMALWIAVRERTGRQDVDGESVLPEDERRAQQIISSFGL